VKKAVIVASWFFTTVGAMAQTSTFSVDKVECKNKFRGSKLVLNYKSDTVAKQSFAYSYDLDFFITVSDSSKLILIAKLLNYESDTARCCLDATSWSFNGIEGCRGMPKTVKHYTLQVDALFIINRLCWPKLMELYSCSPVLYDKKTKKEINSDREKIRCVFQDYKKWYVECKAKGIIPRYFPFNDGRYVWCGGRKSIASKA